MIIVREVNSIDEGITESQKVSNFIKNWQSKNNYNPRFLDEYNAKFNAEFNYFLENSNFSKETISIFKTQSANLDKN